MNTDYYITLLIKKWKDELSPPESSELSEWLAASTNNRMLADEMEKAWNSGDLYDLPFPLDEQKGFERMWQKLQNEKVIPSENLPQPEAKIIPVRQKTYRVFAAAAGLFAVLLIGWWLISDGFKAAEQILITQSEVKQIILPDGSHAWINENSELHYPTTFSGRERLVTLKGEAFFDVTKDASHPFRIAIPGAYVTVLGTSFNVRARSEDEEIEVTVQTGLVRLQSQYKQEFIEITPNQKGIYNLSKNSLRVFADTNLNSLAWQRRNFVFTNTQLEKVLETLAAFYKLKVEIGDERMLKCPFTGRFNTDRGAESILNEIRQVFHMEVEQVEGGFIMKGGECQ